MSFLPRRKGKNVSTVDCKLETIAGFRRIKMGRKQEKSREGRENFRIQMREDEVEEEKETKGERIGGRMDQSITFERM